MDAIIKDTDVLKTLFLNHVVDGNLLSTNLSNGLSVEALGGESLNVKISEDGSIMINNAKVVIADIEASNGVIHVIDAVLSFEADNTIVDIAKANGSFTTLLEAAEAAGLVETLSSPGALSKYL